MDMPVIIIPYCIPGVQDFIQNLDFECVILIDEAEKTFKNTNEVNGDEILLKLIDGVYNQSRKLYILTTNKLTVNENLIGRPGRIMYIHQFKNLSEKAVNDYIDDNLLPQYEDQRKSILETVDLLEISTIDILKSIVDEVNIHGRIDKDSDLNIPKANYVFDIYQFYDEVSTENLERVKLFLKPHIEKGDVLSWLEEDFDTKLYDDMDKSTVNLVKKSIDDDDANNEEVLRVLAGTGGYSTKMTCRYSIIHRGTETNIGELTTDQDELGFCTVNATYGGKKSIIVLNKRSNPSLYSGLLI